MEPLVTVTRFVLSPEKTSQLHLIMKEIWGVSQSISRVTAAVEHQSDVREAQVALTRVYGGARCSVILEKCIMDIFDK